MALYLEPEIRCRIERWQPGGKVLGGGEPSEYLMIIAEAIVDSEQMELVDDPLLRRRHPNGLIGPAPAIFSPEIDLVTEAARCTWGAVCFALGVALSFGPHMTDEFWSRYIPESGRDERVLRMLRTDRPRAPMTGRRGIEVFDGSPADADLIQGLARRRAVRLYPEVLHGIAPTAIFRDLWRTLELAFQAEGKQLTSLISKFSPVQKLGFDKAELERLRAVRGQISHASSRLGAGEVSRSEEEAINALGRLWCLVDRVLLSKRDASRSLEGEELRPLAAFIKSNGATEIEIEVSDERGWRLAFGSANPRFHGARG